MYRYLNNLYFDYDYSKKMKIKKVFSYLPRKRHVKV